VRYSIYKAFCGVFVAALVLAGCGSDAARPQACSSTPHAVAAALSPAPSPEVMNAAVSFDLNNASAAYGTSVHPIPDQPPPVVQPPANIFLPSTLYFVVGQTYRLEFNKFIGGFNNHTDEVVVGPSMEGSVSHPDYWEYTPPAAGSFSLSITVKDKGGATRASTVRPVVVSAARTGSNIRHLSIGDSITRAGGYVEQAVRCIFGGKTVGTRTYDGGTVCVEGRGGWTIEHYLARIGEPTGGDSPFLFPSGVRGAKYRGNTAFWREVTVGDPRGYDYDGFQVMARDWRTSGSYVFDSNGYPASPVIGDVVVDPSEPAGTQWRQYDGSTWPAMEPQPKVGVSFAKYLERYAPAFLSGPPTSISIMLGTVDFLSSPPDVSWATYKSRLDVLINSIRQWNPDVPIILIGPPSGGADNMWADQKITGAEFNRRIADVSRRLYATYDTPDGRAKRVYVISFLGVVSSSNMADYVHPRMPDGHDQMAPWLAGILAYLNSTTGAQAAHLGG